MSYLFMSNFNDRSKLNNIQTRSLALLTRDADKPNSAEPKSISEPIKKAPS